MFCRDISVCYVTVVAWTPIHISNDQQRFISLRSRSWRDTHCAWWLWSTIPPRKARHFHCRSLRTRPVDGTSALVIQSHKEKIVQLYKTYL